MESKKLQGSVAKLTRPPPSKSPIHNELTGVFFSCKLDKTGYSPPDTSPFGSQRITCRIPISQCIHTHTHTHTHTDLFYNSYHQTKDRVYYAILVLIQRDNPNHWFCRDHMIKLDMTANRLIYLDIQRKEFAYYDPSDFKLWVELFVVEMCS